MSDPAYCTDTTRLPTVQEANDFLRVVNDARAAFDMVPLKHVEFDLAEPGSPCGCLSYLALIEPIGGRVLSDSFRLESSNDARMMRAALNVAANKDLWSVTIPPEIRAVTDRFDRLAEEDAAQFTSDQLRARLVEANVVAGDV